MKRIFLILLFLLLACPAWGATYYVSQSGAGAKTGADVDNASAIATFNAGTAPYNALDDDTVYLLDTLTTAVTIPNGGTSGHVATVRGDYVGHPCTITVGATASLKINAKNYVTVDGFNIVNASDDSYRAGVLISGTTDHVSLNNIAIDMSNGANVTRYGLVSSGTATNLSISNVTSTLPRNAENIYIYGTNSANVALVNVTSIGGSESRFKNIQNLTLTNYSQINALGTQSIEIESTVTGLFHGDNISISGGGIGITFNSLFDTGSYLKNSSVMSSIGNSYNFNATSNLAVSNCIAGTTASIPTLTAGYGFYVYGASHNISFDRCNAYQKNGGGFWIQNTGYNITYNRCTSHHTNCDGFGVTDSVHDVSYTKCLSYNNGNIATTADGDGFTAHLTNYNINYDYCTSYNNTASGFGLGGNSSGHVYNCTSYANGGDWSGIGGLTQTRAGFFLPLEGINPTTGISWTLKNNISYGNYPAEIYKNSYATYDYNIYYPLDTSKFENNGDSTYTSWATYHSTYEAHSQYADPKFISATNYHLQSDSLARGAGVNVGLSRTNPPDIGAEPYQQYVPWKK